MNSDERRMLTAPILYIGYETEPMLVRTAAANGEAFTTPPLAIPQAKLMPLVLKLLEAGYLVRMVDHPQLKGKFFVAHGTNAAGDGWNNIEKSSA